MAESEIIVSHRVRIELPRDRELAAAPLEEELGVELDNGRRVRLLAGDKKSAAYAQILSGLEKLRQPVYLEVDSKTEAISLLRIPDVGQVSQSRETSEGFEFQLNSSHARFVLKKSVVQSAQLLEILLEAARGRRTVIVTSNDLREVIDARFFEPGPDDGPLRDFPFTQPQLVPDWLRWLRWPLWPWNWWFGCISATRAQQIFASMSATSCAPLTVPPPCIPFLYPDDGCWARAHEMCRLMINLAFSPRKVWIQGWLHTPTRNNPACFVNWGWHVAPTLCVRRLWFWPPWVWAGQRMVIDPSLFTTPVSVSQWKSVQGDPNATLTYTDSSDYLWGQTDADYSKTKDRLAFYRLKLQERAINVGPPPYANCP